MSQTFIMRTLHGSFIIMIYSFNRGTRAKIFASKSIKGVAEATGDASRRLGVPDFPADFPLLLRRVASDARTIETCETKMKNVPAN